MGKFKKILRNSFIVVCISGLVAGIVATVVRIHSTHTEQ